MPLCAVGYLVSGEPASGYGHAQWRGGRVARQAGARWPRRRHGDQVLTTRSGEVAAVLMPPWWAGDGPPTARSRASAPGHPPVARLPEPGGPDHRAHVAGPPAPAAWARYGPPAGRLGRSAGFHWRSRGGWCGPTRRIPPRDTCRRARNLGGPSDITGRRGGSTATSRTSTRESDVLVALRHRAAPRRPAGGGPPSSGESLTPADRRRANGTSLLDVDDPRGSRSWPRQNSVST